MEPCLAPQSEPQMAYRLVLLWVHQMGLCSEHCSAPLSGLHSVPLMVPLMVLLWSVQQMEHTSARHSSEQTWSERC